MRSPQDEIGKRVDYDGCSTPSWSLSLKNSHTVRQAVSASCTREIRLLHTGIDTAREQRQTETTDGRI